MRLSFCRFPAERPASRGALRRLRRRRRSATLFASPPPGKYVSQPLTAARLGVLVSDIFREIDEELRRDNLLKLWQRYYRYIIGVVVLALVIAGAIVAWRNHQLSLRQAQ